MNNKIKPQRVVKNAIPPTWVWATGSFLDVALTEGRSIYSGYHNIHDNAWINAFVCKLMLLTNFTIFLWILLKYFASDTQVFYYFKMGTVVLVTAALNGSNFEEKVKFLKEYL